ncbi:hypothetical protein [Oceanobacillus salinisoli]|uniref:hypothetical protein n=1 Tax=Oceanobacillus salinisoli TaxID=2678611 RepID=UPI0012E0F3FD|nr:hypothetical protein [Oceanobacillus salinisoli]
MKNLTREQAIERLQEILGENVREKFEKEEKNAGEHGDPNFAISNNEGTTVEVYIDWNKEEDLLSYSLEDV